jgi:transcriptional regulator with XRE-family HTH domain
MADLRGRRPGSEINLVEERVNRGLSTREAAKEIGVSQAVILRAEHGKGERPRPHNAKLIADYYGYKVTDIWPLPARWFRDDD